MTNEKYNSSLFLLPFSTQCMPVSIAFPSFYPYRKDTCCVFSPVLIQELFTASVFKKQIYDEAVAWECVF